MKYRSDPLATAIRGRKLPVSGSPVLTIMGYQLGFPEGDVHANRFYRIYLSLDDTGSIQDVHIAIDGDLISPCSGYFPEMLDEFDLVPVMNWCLSQTIRP